MIRIVIVGAGKSGAYLAEKLCDIADVTVVEQRRDKVERLRQRLPEARILLGDGCEPAMLDHAGITTADFVAASTGDDEDNLVVAHLVKTSGSRAMVFARINHPANEWLFTPEWGVDVPVGAAATMFNLVDEERRRREAAAETPSEDAGQPAE